MGDIEGLRPPKRWARLWGVLVLIGDSEDRGHWQSHEVRSRRLLEKVWRPLLEPAV